MASNDKNGPDGEVVEGSWSPRRSKSSAAKTGKPEAGKSPDPEVLAGEIERTREELAETLDAIAEKVSPKRVAGRTKKKVGDSVKQGTHDAVESVKSTAGEAAEAVKGGVSAVKEKVGGDGGDGDAPRGPLTPATSVEVDSATPLGAVPVEPAGAEAPAYTRTLPPAAPSRLPVVAGAGVALLVLLFLMRRRRR